MYTQIWTKYLPVIKILLKKSLTGEQILNLNVTDFERAGFSRKAGAKFSIAFSNGKSENVITSSMLAKSLSVTLLDDEMVKGLFLQNDYRLTMNPKYQLGIKCTPHHTPESELSFEPVNTEEAIIS